MSESNNKGDVWKFFDLCPNNKWNCQKQNTFTSRKFQLEENFYKKELENNEGTENAWKIFLKTAVIVAASLTRHSLVERSGLELEIRRLGMLRQIF